MTAEWMTPGLVLAGRVLAILAIALLITSLMWRASSAARHFVWTLAAVAVLLLPFVSLVAPRWPVLPVRAAEPVVPPVPMVQPEPPLPARAPVAAEAMPARAPVPRPAPVARPAVASPAMAPATEARPAPAPPARSSVWPALVLALWLAGVLARLGVILVGRWRVRRIAAGAERVWSGPLHDALQEIARAQGLARPVRLFVHADSMPITWGWIYPAVLLPTVARQWPGARVQAVLRHELAHVERADALTQLLAELMCALHWYNPLAWLACARLRVEREHACDDRVLVRGTRATDYASELVVLARTQRLEIRSAHAAMAMARPSTLHSRLAALLDESRNRRGVPRGRALFMTTLALGVLLAVAGGVPAAAIPVDGDVWLEPAPKAGRSVPSPQPAPRSPASILPAVAMAAPVAAPAPLQEVPCLSSRRQDLKQLSTNRNDDEYRLTYRATGCEGEVRVRGPVGFNADFTRITSIAAGGSIRMEEEAGREQRRLEVSPSGSGVSYRWLVNGREAQFDATAQQWLAAMLLVLFRDLGFMAEERALSILERQGADAVLAEVALMRSDHVQTTYLKVLLERGRLAPAMVERVLGIAGRELESDHYLATLLGAVADDFQFQESTRTAFLAATRTLESDHYRHQVLTALLGKGQLTPVQVAAVLDQAGSIDSDHYRAAMLTSVAKRYGMEGAVRAAYLRAATVIDSDHYRAQVLEPLLGGTLSAEDLAAVSQAIAGIDSDHYAHQLLARYVARDRLTDAQVSFVLRTAREIDSDHYKADILTRVARARTLSGELRQEFQRVLDTIDSDHYHGQVSSELARRGGA